MINSISKVSPSLDLGSKPDLENVIHLNSLSLNFFLICKMGNSPYIIAFLVINKLDHIAKEARQKAYIRYNFFMGHSEIKAKS